MKPTLRRLPSISWRRQTARIILLVASILVCDLGWAQSITVVGDPGDWAGTPAGITDPPGNALPGEEDLVAPPITNDASFV